MGFKEKIKGIIARATVLAAVVAGLLAVDVMNVKAAAPDNYEWLCFTNIGDDALTVKIYCNTTPTAFQYNINDTTWENITDALSGKSVTLNANEYVYVRAEESIGAYFESSGGRCKVSGNINSLSYGDPSLDMTLYDSRYAAMFNEFAALEDASELKLPATNLGYDGNIGCYSDMFSGCENLKKAPALPAMNLAESCYANMFAECSSLEKAPSLPASSMADTCYSSMFRECTSLTETPVLPAIYLADGCYASMFEGCTGLTSVPDLPAITLASGCYNSMFASCNGLEMWYEPYPEYDLTREWIINADDTGVELSFMFDGCMNSKFRLNADDPDDKTVCPRTKYYIKALPTPTPTPQKNEASKEKGKKSEKTKYIDLDTNKSEVPYGTVLMLNIEDKSVLQDMKVHPVTTKTKTNQEFLTESYAKKLGKKARIILTKSIHPRNHLLKDQLGAKKTLKWINLEKKAQPIYAVCYNETDKAYYLTGTLDANGTAVFNDFIAREATNITIFVLE